MKNKMKYIILSVSVILLIATVVYKLNDKEEVEDPVVTDAMKFKEEYEGLNGKENDFGSKYPTVEIDEDNAIKYSNASEVKKVVESGTGVIYLGYPTCPWCRSAVPALLHAASDAGIDTVYYINMSEHRDRYSVNDEGDLVLDEKGTDDYQILLEVFDEYLDQYYVKDKDGNEIDTGEKRIYVPVVFFVREGEIVGCHLDTVESQDNPYQVLNDEQYAELYNIYTGLMHEVLNDLCDERC